MQLLDYVLPQVVKLSRSLHMKHLDLSAISSLMDVTLSSSDDVVVHVQAASWALEL